MTAIWKKMLYPPRFKTAEDGLLALRTGDFSKAVRAFVIKEYEGIGKRVVANKEYDDCQFELGYICHPHSRTRV